MVQKPPTVEELYRAMGRTIVRFFARTSDADCVVAPHAILACTGLDSVFLNCGVVFGDGPKGSDPGEGRVREFVARIRGRGTGGYLCLSQSVRPRLEPLARELGLEPLPPTPLLTRGTKAVAPEAGARAGRPALDPAALDVERVTGSCGLAEFLALSEAAFGLPAELYARVLTVDLLDDPALAVYLARLGGSPVAGVCVAAEEGLASVSGMATLPELQRQGIGGVLLRHVLERNRADVRAFCLTASEAGRRLYRAHGFRTVDAPSPWVVPPA